MIRIQIILIATALLFLLPGNLFARNRIALIIGIGDYPTNSGWSKINGDKDVKIISEFLVANQFSKRDIIAIKDSQATKAEIVRQFGVLTNHAQSSDYIYIHFSGHGQQITDMDGDEDDGFDESWIPYDAPKNDEKGIYKGERHLIDDEINGLLKKIKDKIGANGKLIVVTDACHSGDSSRGKDDDFIVRGSTDKFIISSISKPSYKGVNPIQWIEISACKSYQSNYEYKIDGDSFGSLSYSLYLMRDKIANQSLKIIEDMLSGSISQLMNGRLQNPKIESNESLEKQVMF